MKTLASLFVLSFIYTIFISTSYAKFYSIDNSFAVQEITEELVNYFMAQDDIMATTQFIDDRNSSGWTYFSVQSNPKYLDWLQTYTAGYMEGYLAYELVWATWNNEKVADEQKGLFGVPEKVTEFIHNQTNWMIQMVRENPDNNYWKLVNATLALQYGLYDGYIVAITQHGRLDLKLSFEEFYLMTYHTDLDDVVSKYSDIDLHMPRCSFLMKMTEDALYASHVTWSDYTDMLRTYKVYNLNLQNPLVNTKRMSFSAQPGIIPSQDDYYILDNNRVVTETTLENENSDLYSYLHYDSLPYWVRITVSNLAFTSQRSFADLYFTHRSGTYNNMWIVIDFNQYNASKDDLSKARDIIWFIEEFYNFTSARDVTQELLVKQGYVASYNVPYNETLQKFSNDSTNYTTDPRYHLFKKYAPRINNQADFQYVMRLNNVSDTKDFCEAISSRCDLDKDADWPWGAIDSKVVSDSSVGEHQTWIITGPTYEMEKPFKWSNWPEFEKKVAQMSTEFHFNWTFIDPSQNFTVSIPIDNLISKNNIIW